MQNGRPRREGGQFERSGFSHTQDRPLHSLDGFELQAGTPHWLDGAAHHARPCPRFVCVVRSRKLLQSSATGYEMMR